jgi:hypothetical protein
MAQHYRAIKASYGFRSRYWAEGDIAHDVTEAEKASAEIVEFFVAVPEGEDVPPLPEPDIDNTLSGHLPNVNTEGKVPETLSEAQGLDKPEEPLGESPKKEPVGAAPKRKFWETNKRLAKKPGKSK